jgi:predicted MFS family arabinose efflux permease
MVETLWDWMFVFYVAAALGVAALIFIRWSRPTNYPKEFVCDGCGQVCTTLRVGLCVYCDKQFTPTSQKPLT